MESDCISSWSLLIFLLYYQHSYLPTTYIHTYIHIYLHTYLPTYPYIHNFIRIVPIVPHPTFCGSHWSSFRSELKSIPVRFGTHWSPFRSVSAPIEVHFGIFAGPFRSVSVCVGPFRSVPVRFGKSWYNMEYMFALQQQEQSKKMRHLMFSVEKFAKVTCMLDDN